MALMLMQPPAGWSSWMMHQMARIPVCLRLFLWNPQRIRNPDHDYRPSYGPSNRGTSNSGAIRAGTEHLGLVRPFIKACVKQQTYTDCSVRTYTCNTT